jgi:dTDP-4-amino-4,6-dideoxy-D-galactose acyltransferase
MTRAPAEFERVAWDSDFFGLSIARVLADRPSHTDLSELLERAERRSVDCLYYLVDASDAPTISHAQRAGFRLVDVRITLDCVLAEAELDERVRQASAADVARLREIAAYSHRNTRFYADGNFALGRCDELYAHWIERSVEAGFADAVLVRSGPSGVVGYVTCSLGANETGSIGLCGVALEARGEHIGSGLVAAALGWLRQRGMRSASVVTQGNNIAAQRLYQKAGMRTTATALWLHAWPRLEKSPLR